MVLQAIRERLTGILAIFIFAILIVPFAFVGVNSYFSSDSVNSVARVNDTDITTTEFTNSFQNYRRRMQGLLGANFDAEQFDQPIVRRQHLDSLIDQEILRQVSTETGLAIDDESLALAIREIAAFQVDGEFNQDVYQSRLLSQGQTPKQFENNMRAQLLLDQYPGAIATSSIVTDAELAGYVRLQEQKRAFKAWVVIAEPAPADAADGDVDEADEQAGDVPAPPNDQDAVAAEAVTVDDAEILAWYEAHPQDFRTQEQVLIEYLELNAADLGEDVQPDEEQLRSRFEGQKARFISPETRLASHILIEVAPDADEANVATARQSAQDLAQRARDGEDFAALASEYSQDAGSSSVGGDLGWVEPGFMVQAFEDGLYGLSLENPVSQPVQTGFGWHVIYLRDIRPAEGMTFEEAREILTTEFVAEQAERRFLEVADRLVDLIYEDPTTLSSAAEVLELEVQTAGPFGRAGGEGIASNPDVIRTAFSELVLQGGVSDPVDLGDNHMIMLRVREHMPEAIKPLEQVREQVVASIRRERAMQRAAALAAELLLQMEAGVDVAALPAADAVELIEAEAASRDDPAIRSDLLRQVFQMPTPEGENPRSAVVALDDGYAAVQLSQVIDGALAEDALAEKQNYRRRISNAAASTEALGFIRRLRSQSEIEVFEDRL